jgi:hypothetical protein
MYNLHIKLPAVKRAVYNCMQLYVLFSKYLLHKIRLALHTFFYRILLFSTE